ncbi:hypothetical protein [Vaccinia virus]|nr:hypothetical protein [Vaccinia virus]
MVPHTSDTTSTFRLKTVFDLVFENRNIKCKGDVVNDIIHHRLKVSLPMTKSVFYKMSLPTTITT